MYRRVKTCSCGGSVVFPDNGNKNKDKAKCLTCYKQYINLDYEYVDGEIWIPINNERNIKKNKRAHRNKRASKLG